jgi:predicted dehydrogenase
MITRRDWLGAAGLAGLATAAGGALAQGGNARQESVEPDAIDAEPPPHRLRFAVIGLDHYHIMSMTEAVISGGGEVVAVFSTNTEGLKDRQLADFHAKFGAVNVARSEDEILQDPSIALVAAAPIPDQRAPLGIRVMQAGKDYLADKPAITTLAQLDAVRAAIAETGRKFAIMYSERLGVRSAVQAGRLIQAGAIGRVVQVVNLAPHRVNAPSRPAWFWDKARYGGILTDIGSHQIDQYLYYTSSTRARVVAAQTANLNWPQQPAFEDFGDLLVAGDGGTGYIRVDWFTPDGLGVWGDGRLFVLGTEGYIESRKYIDPAGREGGNHLLLVDQEAIRYFDCSRGSLPFGRQFVDDLVNRTETAQSQAQALLAAELVLTAQRDATAPVLD